MTESLILAIEASTYTGTVAVISVSGVVSEREVAMRGKEEERLMPAVAEALSEAGVPVNELGAVVCGGGPGSFTSLRIAASIAKGIASGCGIPLYSAPSLLLMVAGSACSNIAGRYLAVLDAMREEVFAACYEISAGGTIQEIAPATLLSTSSLEASAAALDAKIMGVGRQLEAIPHARGVALCRRSGLISVDVGAWEPEYGRLAEAQVRWELTNARPLRH